MENQDLVSFLVTDWEFKSFSRGDGLSLRTNNSKFEGLVVGQKVLVYSEDDVKNGILGKIKKLSDSSAVGSEKNWITIKK